MIVFWEHFHFFAPIYLLGALGYTLLGRLLLGLFLPTPALRERNYIWRFFRLLTDWFLRLLEPLTPSFLTDWAVLLYAFFWTLLARLLFYIALHLAGLAPDLALI